MIPDGIKPEHIKAALSDLRKGVQHRFGKSTGYDLLYKGLRYPPKAAIGLAAGKLTGHTLGPYDFTGGIGSKCFRILEQNGFEIVRKPNFEPFPDEIDLSEGYFEGAASRVTVNRYERDPSARMKCIRHHGKKCLVCGFDFQTAFGEIGEDFIHVHHIVPISEIGEKYRIDPIRDLRPVCPNCHAMLHRRTPPYLVEELKALLIGRVAHI